jgi:putative hydrolase of the HAD superfamily
LGPVNGTAADAAAAATWPSPRGLLLDAMGTLIGLRASVGHTYAAVAAEFNIHLDAAALDRAFGAVYRSAPPLAFPGLRGAQLDQAERRWWAERIDALLQAVGQPPPPAALHRRLFDRYAEASLWRVHDDVPAALERWRRRGLRLAVVSNFDQRLDGLLEQLGLRPLLDAVVISSRAGAAKPSPLPFQQALAALDLEPAEAWHIGDSPEDASGARAAGLPCLLVQRR